MPSMYRLLSSPLLSSLSLVRPRMSYSYQQPFPDPGTSDGQTNDEQTDGRNGPADCRDRVTLTERKRARVKELGPSLVKPPSASVLCSLGLARFDSCCTRSASASSSSLASAPLSLPSVSEWGWVGQSVPSRSDFQFSAIIITIIPIHATNIFNRVLMLCHLFHCDHCKFVIRHEALTIRRPNHHHHQGSPEKLFGFAAAGKSC